MTLIYITYCLIREKVQEWRKRKARALLHNEIDGYMNEIKKFVRYQKIIDDMRNREAILCPTLLKEIIDMLPDPNRIGDVEIATTIRLRRTVEMSIPGRGIVKFDLRFVADKEDVPTGEEGLTVKIEPTGQEVRFTLKHQNHVQRIQGVDVQIDGWGWDLRFSGIQLISNEGFVRMIDFILSSRVVNEAFGLPLKSSAPSFFNDARW